MLRRLSCISCAFALAFFVGSCAENPVTGETEFSLMSEQQEIEIGSKNYLPYQQQQGGEYQVDRQLSAYVSSVGKKLASVSDKPNLPYEFVVLNNNVPNAWALPGGKIAINRGLMLLLEDEAQLAAVLSHEIVHAAARHGASQMSQAALVGMGVAVAGAASQESEYGQLVGIGAGLGAASYQAKYGRQQEFDSDYYGIKYMSKAGYEPKAAIELQEKFVELSKGRKSDWLSDLFASHPPSQERVDKNHSRSSKFPPGVRNKQAYKNAIYRIRKDRAAYDMNQKAQKAIADGNLNAALAMSDKAIKMQPKEAQFHITRGKALFTKEDYANAQKSFTKAVNLNPKYFLSNLSLGLTQKKRSNFSAAEASLEAAAKLLQTTIGAYHLGEIALERGQGTKAIEYFKYAAQDKGELGKAAQGQLNKLQPQPAQ